MRQWIHGVTFVTVLMLALAGRAQLTPALTAADLDLAQCQAFEEGRALGMPSAETLAVLLGLKAAGNKLPEWATGPVAGRDRHFRIVFTRPLALGTICTSYSGGRSADTLFQLGAGTSVSYLKADAAAPGDVAKDEQWITLPPGAVKTLPPGATVRALRFTDRRVQLPWANLEWGAESSSMGLALLIKERCYNAVNLGNAKGGGTWTGYWTAAQPVAGIALLPQQGQPLVLETLKADATIHPALAPAAQWTRVQVLNAANGPVLFSLPAAISTKAIRLRDGAIGPVMPLVNLGEKPTVPSLALPPPPFAINYPMPLDGFVAINITDTKTGKPVRRLLAEVARLKGPVTEYWDLKDDNGRFVPPGAYTWKGIARPPLKLTYEGTVNNAGQPPWYAPVRGGGGWMADHCTPVSVCAVGDLVFHGTYGAEYGQPLIATDRDGNKLWASHTGADRLTTDGRYLYAVSPSGVTRIDSKSFAGKRLINLGYNRDLPGPGGVYNNFNGDTGAAAVHGNRMIISYRAPSQSWLQSSFLPGDIDGSRCSPMPKSRPRVFPEHAYDDYQRLISAFMTGGHPNSNVYTWGDAPANGALAGTITLVFRKPIPVGSILLPPNAGQVYALKPGAPVPSGAPEMDAPDADIGGGDLGLDEDAFDPDRWVQLSTVGRKGGQPGIALAPTGGVMTQALRFKAPRIAYCSVFNRRFTDLAPTAERVLGEGSVTETGGWQVQRPPTTPITGSNPAVMALVWKTPQALRGVTLVNPTRYGQVAVDYWIGAADADPRDALSDNTQWQFAGTLESVDSSLNNPVTPNAGNIDFGAVRTTRAVRVRLLVPSGALAFGRPVITGPHRGGFDTVFAYSPLGDDPKLPAPLNERLTELRLPDPADEKGQTTIVRHLPFDKPGFMTFDKNGTFYTVSGNTIVTLNLDEENPTPKVVIGPGKLNAPHAMTFDADGLLYVIDGGPNVVKVFNVQTGALVRTIGTPGGYKLGLYDPTRFDNPMDLTIDSAGKLWVTDEFNQPKRITRWSREGKLEKTFFGPTYYGGGGIMDAGDRSVSYLGMKFVVDWNSPTHEWKLLTRTNRPEYSAFADRALYYQGKRFLVADVGVSLFADPGQISIIYEEKDGIGVPLAMAGNLAKWGEVYKHKELVQAYGKMDRTRYGFVWSDLNRDGKPQVTEMQLTDKHTMLSSTHVGEDLSLNFNGGPGARIPLKELRADGLPIYDLTKLETRPYDSATWTLADGRAFIMGNRMLATDGQTVQWSYPDNYMSVQTSAGAPGGFANRPAGVLVGELRIMGRLTVGKEELFVTNGNHGDWYAFTSDGLFAGCIFGGPSGYGRRWWSMPECVPGKTDLSDLRLTVEDFYGGITSASDGKVYAIAGKNHNSIVRVDGLERMQRMNGVLTVTAADIQKSQTWEVERAALERASQEPKVAYLPYIDNTPAIDGSLDDWPESILLTIYHTLNEAGTTRDLWQAGLAYDAEKLYIAGRATDESAMVNSADDLTRLFQFGDGLDILLGLDAKANPGRTQTTDGDIRLVISRVKGKPVVMAYRYAVPGTADDKRTVFTSPVGKEIVDQVFEVKDVEISITQRYREGWVAEVAIPWQSLGLTPPRIGEKLRADVGVLESDGQGTATVRRMYWANKSQVVLGDLPSEARSSPALWGELQVIEPPDEMRFGGPDGGDDLMPF